MDRKATYVLSLVTTFLFFIITLARVFRHEPWRDEVGAWLHVQDGASFFDLLASLDYGGHPILWPMVLVPLASVFDDPLAMQVLHVVIATASVYLVLRFAPFSLPAKLLLCFGYYLGFEYAVISRQYSLAILFFFGFLSVRDRFPQNLVVPSVLLVAAAATSVHGWILAFAAGCAVTAGCWTGQNRFTREQAFAGTSIVVVGLALVVFDMVPPSDHGFHPQWHFSLAPERMQRILGLIWEGYFLRTLPVNQTIMASLSMALVVSTVYVLRRNAMAVTLYLVATIGLIAFFYTKYEGFLRHHGFLYITFVGALWICMSGRGAGEVPGRSLGVLWYPMLVVQVLGNLSMSYMDWRYPFSGGRDAAALIREKRLDVHPMIGHMPHQMGTISAYLGKPMYLVQLKEEARRVIWDARHRNSLDLHEIKAVARQRANELGQPALLILSHPFKLARPARGFQFIARVPEYAIKEHEVFYLYLVLPDDVD